MTQYYVSQSATNGYSVGSDTANDGSSIKNPWLTVEHAIAKMQDGDGIIINDGVYTHSTAYYSCGAAGEITAANPYAVTLRAKGAQAQVFFWATGASKTCTLGELIIDGQDVCTTSVLTNSPVSPNTYIFRGTHFKATTTSLVTLNGYTSTHKFTNIKLEGGCSTYGIYYNFVSTGTLIVDGVEVALTKIAAQLGGAIYFQATANTSSLFIRNIFGIQTNRPSATAPVITAFNAGTLLIEGPGWSDGPKMIINEEVKKTAEPALIKILTYNSVQVSNPIINGFKGENQCNGGYLIAFGNDGPGGNTVDYFINDPICTNCDVRGNPASSSMHGIMLGTVLGGSVSRNRIRGVVISTLSKLQTRPGVFYDNDLDEGKGGGSGHCYSKGTANVLFACNTIHLNASYPLQAFRSGSNTIPSTTYATNVRFIGNNIIADTPVSYIAVVGGVGDNSTASFAFNYYSLAGVTDTPWTYGTAPTKYANLASWAAAHEPTARS